MSSFEDSIKSKTLSSGKNDPAATDLDYYSKPENYTGSNLQSLQRFKADKTKEDRAADGGEKKKVVKDAKYHFFHRYKHILHDAIFLQDLLEREKEDTSEEEEDEEGVCDGGLDLAPGNSRPPTSINLKTITEETNDTDAYLRSEDEHSPSMDPSHFIQSTSAANQNDDIRDTPDSGYSGIGSVGSGKRKPTSAGRQSTALQRVQMDKISRDIRAKELKVKFIKAVRVVKQIVRLSASARGNAEKLRHRSAGDMSSMRTFMDIADEGTNTDENIKNAGLSFDPSYYKAKKEISLSAETKNILTTPSEKRTPEQVQTAMFGLQCLRSFAEYPLHMQAKLANVAWYEVVAPKRIIIRQGHMAENFYFILSGHAVVTILLRNPQTGASFVKTATVMKKGMSFGELALLHHSKRTATVTSQDEVQLLSIGREDFFDIFMASEGPDSMPEHIKFISNLDFMKDWPIDELVEHPEFCLLHFFKRNTTIVADSNNSEWMYIVKSGSCQVLKKLKGVTAKTYSAKPKVDDLWESPKLKAIVFAPKVQTRFKKSKSKQKHGEKKEMTQDTEEQGDGQKRVKFSKDKYSQNPDTKTAHFSSDSCFSKRKHYEPPKTCRPKMAEKSVEPIVAAKPGPVFVQVSNMKPRDIFGLESIQFDDDVPRSHTSVSLVSSAAECIMLSKEFYIKHANEAVKKRVRQFVRPYPEEEVFQENLQIKEDWVMYKRVMMTDVTSQIKDKNNRFFC